MTAEEWAMVALILVSFRLWLATRDLRFLVACDLGREALAIQLFEESSRKG